MPDQKVERASCRFVATTNQDTAILRLELFHPLPSLADTTVEFELLKGTTLEQAKKLAESLTERTIGIIVTTINKN
jgi:hypothetical protein